MDQFAFTDQALVLFKILEANPADMFMDLEFVHATSCLIDIINYKVNEL